MPGPATLKTLISYAKSCGIINSFNFLTKQSLNITKIATTRTPDKLITDLAEYKFINPTSNIKKINPHAKDKAMRECQTKVCKNAFSKQGFLCRENMKIFNFE